MKSNLRITAAVRFISLFMAGTLLLTACGSADIGDTSMDTNMETSSGDTENVSI